MTMIRKKKPTYTKPFVHVRQTHPMWRYGQSPRQARITAYIGIVLALIMCVWMGTYLNKLPGWVNDQRLDMLARDVFGTELPENTQIEDRQYTMRNLEEEGSCAFVVRQDMRSQLTSQDIYRYYQEIDYALRIPQLTTIGQRTSPEVIYATGIDQSAGVVFSLQVRIDVQGSPDPRCRE